MPPELLLLRIYLLVHPSLLIIISLTHVAEWAGMGECEANAPYMLSNCEDSCKKHAEEALSNAEDIEVRDFIPSFVFVLSDISTTTLSQY